MPVFEKHFTPDEANALIPEVTSLLESLQGLRQRLGDDWKAASPVIQAAHQNGGGAHIGPYVSSLAEVNRCLQRLAAIGVQLKDLDRGLVDFPAWRGEEEVLLCWHLGEEAVAHWHDLESGFSGRRPLP